MNPNGGDEKLTVLGVTPARGGSKSIPGKNVYPLAGKPLIVWTLEAAQRTRLLDRIVVSTDDEEIAEVSRRALEYLEQTEGYVPDAVALLQCTSPLRGASIIDAGIRKLVETGCDVVMTVAPLQHWFLCGQIAEEDQFKPEYDYQGRRFTHELTEKYSENGALYVTRTHILRQQQCRLGGDVRVIVMDPIRSIDIDNYQDMELAQEVIQAFGPPD